MGMARELNGAINSLKTALGRWWASTHIATPSIRFADSSGVVRRLTVGTGLGVILIAIVYVVIGELSGTVNNTDLSVTAPKGGSSLVATLAGTVERELANGWCPSGA
jgi:hypothetical protein